MSQLIAEAPIATLDASDALVEYPVEFDKESVAELSLVEIESMTHDDLLSAIRAVVLPFVDEDRLEYQDRQTLLRLLYLARQSCRNQGY